MPSTEISFKVPQCSNIFPDNAVEGGKQPPCNRRRWAVKSNKFIPVLTDIEAAVQYILKIIRCLCKSDGSSGRCRC